MQLANEIDSDPKKILYFVPGQVILQVEHPNFGATELHENITANFRKFYNNCICEKDPPIKGYLLDSVTIDPKQIMTRLGPEGQMGRSFVQVNVTEYATMAYNDNRFDAQADNSILTWFIETAFERLGIGPFLSNGISLVSLSPNWLLTGSQPTSGGTGGPGSKPVRPYAFNITNPPYKFKAAKALAPASLTQVEAVDRVKNLIGECEGEKTVDVIVLDTAPLLNGELITDPAALLDAFPKHPILEKLCPKLKIDYYDIAVEPGGAGIMDKLNSSNYGIGIRGHHYDMSDHGLFISGIINTIAPEANIELIQILNKYGVGSLWTITHGIEYAGALIASKTVEKQKPRVVINCSFTIMMPLPTRRSLRKNGKVFHAHIHRDLSWPNIDIDSAMVHYLVKHIEAMFSPIIDEAVLVVAAAGNDNEASRPRPQSRLPAQLPNVIGVAALKRTLDTVANKYDYAEAEYSNIADTPESDGVTVFGGNITSNNKADDKDGILGVYIGKFPDCTQSDGWARWSGTSFAAPIIAGMLACLLRSGRTPQEAKDVINNAVTEVPPGVQLFLIDQGS